MRKECISCGSMFDAKNDRVGICSDKCRKIRRGAQRNRWARKNTVKQLQSELEQKDRILATLALLISKAKACEACPVGRGGDNSCYRSGEACPVALIKHAENQ